MNRRDAERFPDLVRVKAEQDAFWAGIRASADRLDTRIADAEDFGDRLLLDITATRMRQDGEL
jgi:hypothetical protein